MGNEYIEHLQTLLPYIPALVAELDSFVTIQDGFRVKLLTLEEYQQLQVMIVEAAKSVFDQELFLARGVGVTGTGYHVLRVLYGTHSNEKMDYTLPHLIHARLMESEHRYTELLELVSADGIPVEVLRKLVDIRINIARAITDAMLNFEEEKG
jgi:hypothetical protein